MEQKSKLPDSVISSLCQLVREKADYSKRLEEFNKDRPSGVRALFAREPRDPYPGVGDTRELLTVASRAVWPELNFVRVAAGEPDGYKCSFGLTHDVHGNILGILDVVDYGSKLQDREYFEYVKGYGLQVQFQHDSDSTRNAANRSYAYSKAMEGRLVGVDGISLPVYADLDRVRRSVDDIVRRPDVPKAEVMKAVDEVRRFGKELSAESKLMMDSHSSSYNKMKGSFKGDSSDLLAFSDGVFTLESMRRSFTKGSSVGPEVRGTFSGLASALDSYRDSKLSERLAYSMAEVMTPLGRTLADNGFNHMSIVDYSRAHFKLSTGLDPGESEATAKSYLSVLGKVAVLAGNHPGSVETMMRLESEKLGYPNLDLGSSMDEVNVCQRNLRESFIDSIKYLVKKGPSSKDAVLTGEVKEVLNRLNGFLPAMVHDDAMILKAQNDIVRLQVDHPDYSYRDIASVLYERGGAGERDFLYYDAALEVFEGLGCERTMRSGESKHIKRAYDSILGEDFIRKFKEEFPDGIADMDSSVRMDTVKRMNAESKMPLNSFVVVTPPQAFLASELGLVASEIVRKDPDFGADKLGAFFRENGIEFSSKVGLGQALVKGALKMYGDGGPDAARVVSDFRQKYASELLTAKNVLRSQKQAVKQSKTEKKAVDKGPKL